MSVVDLSLWEPKTALGRMVKEGKIRTIDEIFANNLLIKEPEIVDILLPGLKQELLNLNLVQRQTHAGERNQFQAVVAVGNEDGYVGVGIGKSRQVRQAIEKATREAKLNITPVRRGCGSWKCSCDEPHSVPFVVSGKSGSVEVTLIPAPKGVGLVAGDVAKVVLRLAGIKDVWTKTRGDTRTTLNFALAVFNALRNTYYFKL
ncbi:30S ribosomal protein S5 [Pyrobaculum calidifontis]|uniref:Small ribosomal subunit protein uS5 n=1 Tax=Pyrobaculum calidifontis (strain DSM 21063 / JCM 11548 / VA1) TaxID=410359 RepID=RS5_PYRCJ|nr:30S ribosomal protein S5 [Pyrobaculum calidifontis]A3MU88.1 RecName: Full=Small ribosomal subunit protein uS5; AltName: Full=30S ribosomal protein S5 [Pyrobaculum calidifontis JCM 11548]ABO08205.1 SSU ribosomal protein S5P [Pyrobaculum calidifontis JCM 11548]